MFVIVLAGWVSAAATIQAPASLADRLDYIERPSNRDERLGAPQLRLFDVAPIDYNGDGFIDVATTNHSYPGALLENAGDGTFRRVTQGAGFGLVERYPGFEQIDRRPSFAEPGLYAYLSRAQKHSRHYALTLVAHRTSASGSVSLYPNRRVDALSAMRGKGRVEKVGKGKVVTFSLNPGGRLKLATTLQTPATLSTDRQTFIGPRSIPAEDEKVILQLPDRHGMAQADLNLDGLEDLAIVNGGVGGEISRPEVRSSVSDERLLFDGTGYSHSSIGPRKASCRGRSIGVVDADSDGFGDIFMSCEGHQPEIDLRTPTGWSRERIPTRSQVFRWIQLGTRSRPKLLALGNRATLWSRINDRWQATQSEKLLGPAEHATIADFDGNGQPDIFVSSRRGNTLLSANGSGRLRARRPAKLNLPVAGTIAAWVDQDGDGRADLHQIPTGLYRQQAGGRFKETSRARVSTQFGHLSWVDLDNDGDREMIYGLAKREFAKRGKVFVSGKRRGNWLSLDLLGSWNSSRIEVTTPQMKAPQVGWAGQSETSRHSQTHNRVYFSGLKGKVATVVVTRPDGSRLELSGGVDQVLSVGGPG